MSRKLFQQIFTVGSIIAFFGSTTYSAIALFTAVNIRSHKLDKYC